MLKIDKLLVIDNWYYQWCESLIVVVQPVNGGWSSSPYSSRISQG